MKEKINIKTMYKALPFFGLVLLLLLSPCKVRNFIQAELDIPQTEVTNKSQSTISNSDCNELEYAKSSLSQEKSSFEFSYPASINFDLPFIALDYSNNYTQPHIARNHLASTIPLYLLYQNFKDYL